MAKTKCYVYFIQADSGPIKIGSAIDPRARLALTQTWHYENLTLLGVIEGSRLNEKALHRRFRAAQIRGEWFRPAPDVLALVATSFEAPIFEKPGYVGAKAPLEREAIEKAILDARGNITIAARLLSCSRRTLQNKMRSYGIAAGKAGRPSSHASAQFRRMVVVEDVLDSKP